MANFLKSAATAKRLIEKNGRLVQLLKANTAPDNPAEPWLGNSNAPSTGEGGDSRDVKVAFVPPSGSGLGRSVVQALSGNGKRLDEIGLIASASLPAGVNLEGFDRVRDGSDIWQIVGMHHLKPADVSILFAIGLTK